MKIQVAERPYLAILLCETSTTQLIRMNSDRGRYRVYGSEGALQTAIRLTKWGVPTSFIGAVGPLSMRPRRLLTKARVSIPLGFQAKRPVPMQLRAGRWQWVHVRFGNEVEEAHWIRLEQLLKQSRQLGLYISLRLSARLSDFAHSSDVIDDWQGVQALDSRLEGLLPLATWIILAKHDAAVLFGTTDREDIEKRLRRSGFLGVAVLLVENSLEGSWLLAIAKGEI